MTEEVVEVTGVEEGGIEEGADEDEDVEGTVGREVEREEGEEDEADVEVDTEIVGVAVFLALPLLLLVRLPLLGTAPALLLLLSLLFVLLPGVTGVLATLLLLLPLMVATLSPPLAPRPRGVVFDPTEAAVALAAPAAVEGEETDARGVVGIAKCIFESPPPNGLPGASLVGVTA